MADEQGKPPADRYYTEYLRVPTEGGAANELLREAIDQKTQRGWRLLSMVRDPSGDGVVLVWDTSGA